MELLHSTIHLNENQTTSNDEKEIHITVYTSDEESIKEEIQKHKKTKAGSKEMASKNAQFKAGEGCFAKVQDQQFIVICTGPKSGSWVPLLAGKGDQDLRELGQRGLLRHQGGRQSRPQGPRKGEFFVTGKMGRQNLLFQASEKNMEKYGTSQLLKRKGYR